MSMGRPAKSSRRAGAVKITKAWLKTLAATGKRESYYDATVDHLVLRVGPNGESRVWYLSYRNRAGERRLYRIGSLEKYDPESAKETARKLNGSIAKGADPAAEKAAQKADEKASESRTLEKYLDGKYWTDTLKSRRSGEATKARIKAAWKPFLDTDMSALDIVELREHRSRRQDEGKKPQTLNRDRTALLALLNQAVADKVLDVNPVADFDRLEAEDDKRVRYLGQRDKDEAYFEQGRKVDERERFMTALQRQPHYLRAMTELALNTGMRRGEIFQLRWESVDLKRGEITVRAATAKGNKTRVVPMTARAIEVLRVWRKEQTEDGKVLPMSRLVFPNPKSKKPFTSIKKAWRTLLKAAQVEDFHLHDCRHDFASRLVMEGVYLYVVRDLLGHSTIQLTERYSHLADDVKRKAVDVLNEGAS
jgi:integrase